MSDVLKAKLKRAAEKQKGARVVDKVEEEELFKKEYLEMREGVRIGEDGGSFNIIPRFYKPLPGEEDALQQKLREEARAQFLQRRSKLLLDNAELKELWVVLDTHTSGPPVGEEQMMDWDQFCKVRELVSLKCKEYLKHEIQDVLACSFLDDLHEVFAKLQQGDRLGRISIMALFNYVMRKVWLHQTRIGLSLYDVTGQGFLRESDLENYILELIETLPQLDGLEKSFHSFYVCTAVRKFFFFLDPLRTGKIKIQDDEVVKYGKREAIRANSLFFHLFKRPLDKLLNEEENINAVTNPLYCPDLLLLICTQYLALFPLINASVLPGENLGLRNNAYVELYWQELRRIFASIPKRQLWPPQYLGMLHEEIQRKATEIILRKFIPNLRTGGKVHQKAVTFADTLGDDDNLFKGGRPGSKNTEFFKPQPSKKKKAGKPKESFNESFETWAKNERCAVKRKSSTYMKDKVIDYASIEQDNFSVKRKNAVVTGPGAAKGQYPQRINIFDAEIGAILTKNHNIDNEVLDASLSLIDRKLSEDCHYVEGVTVYNNTTIRLILTGEDYWVQDGQFLAIFPRRFALEEEAELAFGGQGEKREVYIGHFTLVSNIRCEEGEVRVYETLPAYRNPKTLLTEEQKKLLKKLAKIKDEKLLRVDCVDVCPQREQECGAISFGLAVQLCFTFPEEKSLFASFVDVRRDFVKCLRANDVVMFETLKRDVSSDVLFSIDI